MHDRLSDSAGTGDDRTVFLLGLFAARFKLTEFKFEGLEDITSIYKILQPCDAKK